MRKLLLAIAITTILALTIVPMASAAGKLVIYSPATKATTDLIVNMFNKKYPDITVEVINAGTGELATRIKAEKVRPGGDVLLTGGTETVDTMLDFIQPYKCANDADFAPDFKHPEYYYYAFSLPLQVFIINTKLVSEKDAPQTWKELAEPKWKGKVIMANPSASGSAYAQLNIMLQLYGWDMVKGMLANTSITSSSKLSYQNVANGEYAIGLTGEANVYNLIEEGYPVKAVYPKDGTALRYDTVSIIKNGPNLENAKKFIDFVTTKEVYTLIANEESRRMGRNDVPVKAGLLPTAQIKFMKYDEKYAADNKKAILEKFDDLFANK
ncbi:MAG TPA: extracellular solute-binding protein [Bacillota bacterium]|nr:extracellular solute-binding protein [Bacillota bacterium]HOH10960.1 extracellular solute-binding protein [Bacillota bacterium]HOS49906.1 extracellular solute-binding protein [Bacillota bacterium]HOY88770.1 extracellular solute-binding protein [Bacillota bacterium]HPI01860.1 extracellular solute-binding protein [Bacillota bacterium]